MNLSLNNYFLTITSIQLLSKITAYEISNIFVLYKRNI